MLSTDATVDLSFVEEEAQISLRGPCPGWFKLLLATFGKDLKQVPLLQVFQVAAGRPEMKSLLYQLMWNLSRAIDMGMGGQVTGKQVHSRVVFQWLDIKALLGTPASICRKLAEYVYEGAQLSIGQSVFSISTDKASVKGLSLTNSVIVFPNNLAIVCCPVVRWQSMGCQIHICLHLWI